MASHTKLKKELVAQYLDFGREFLDLLGMPAKERKKQANTLVAQAEGKATDGSETALRAAFNSELLDQANVMLRSLVTAFAQVTGRSQDLPSLSVGSNRNERLDVEAHRQPKQHSIPSGNGFPKY